MNTGTDRRTPCEAALSTASDCFDGYLSLEGGFLPIKALEALPAPYDCWETLAGQLADMYLAGNYGDVDAIPTLAVDEEALPCRYLCRAAVVLGNIAHGVYYFSPQHRGTVPACIATPWAEVCRRLGRPVAALSYLDLFLHNWHPNAPDTSISDVKAVQEELVVAVPVFKGYGEREEHVFNLTMVDMHLRSRRLVALCVDLQRAVVDDDVPKVMSLLRNVLQLIDDVIEAFLVINPHPDSQYFVDPVIWSKTVAPVGVPVYPGARGPSGLAAPVFLLLDALLSRSSYESELGKLSLVERSKDWCPVAHRAFYRAVEQLPVRDFVRAKVDARHPFAAELQDVFDDVVDRYIGEHGFLGIHKLKVYGFMEMAMKGGRVNATGGFEGSSAWTCKPWYDVTHTLCESAMERSSMRVGSCPFKRGSVALAEPVSEPPSSVSSVSTAVSPSDLRAPARSISGVKSDPSSASTQYAVTFGPGAASYRAGDRCAIVPRNDKESVRRTLAAFELPGSTLVPLSEQWSAALAEYGEAHLIVEKLDEPGSYLALGQFFERCCFRPLSSGAATAILGVLGANNPIVLGIAVKRAHEFELWDFLATLRNNVRAKDRFADPLQFDVLLPHLSVILPPLQPRQYSVCCSPAVVPHSDACAAVPKHLEILVGTVEYATNGNVLWDHVLQTILCCLQDSKHRSMSSRLTSFTSGEAVRTLSQHIRAVLDNDTMYRQSSCSSRGPPKLDDVSSLVSFKRMQMQEEHVAVALLRVFMARHQSLSDLCMIGKTDAQVQQLEGVVTLLKHFLASGSEAMSTPVSPAATVVDVPKVSVWIPGPEPEALLSVQDMARQPRDPSLWQPDSSARDCRICQADFNLRRRRHHCRACGFVVCDECSRQRWPFRSGEPSRVCSTCWNAMAALSAKRVTTSDKKPAAAVVRRGTCSAYLRDTASGGSEASVLYRVYASPLFRLPASPSTPLLLIAFGSGVSPFFGFLQERFLNPACPVDEVGEVWLLWGVKSSSSVQHVAFFQSVCKAARGKFHLRISCSRECKAATCEFGDKDEHVHFETVASPSRITDAFRRGGMGCDVLKQVALDAEGHVYLCGKPDVLVSLRDTVLASFPERPLLLETLVGHNRLHLDCFDSGPGAAPGQTPIPYSRVGRHFFDTSLDVSSCGPAWSILGDAVYDITDYLRLHPGGYRLLVDKAGRDMTEDFVIAHGHDNWRVRNLASPFRIGPVDRPQFRDPILSALYHAWCGCHCRTVQTLHILCAEWRTCVDAQPCVGARDVLTRSFAGSLVHRLLRPILEDFTNLGVLTNEITAGALARCPECRVGSTEACTYCPVTTKPLRWQTELSAPEMSSLAGVVEDVHASLASAILRLCDGIQRLESATSVDLETSTPDTSHASMLHDSLSVIVLACVSLFK